MIRRLSAAVLALGVSVFGATNGHAADAMSPEQLARRSFEIMAGPAWDEARYFEFSFDVVRKGEVVASYPQRLDRFEGMYRVEGKNKEGKAFVIVMNVNTKQGQAWVDGVLADDPTEWLTLGYRRFINDTYWLMMPLKLRDPGVHLESAGERSDECGGVWDVVKLSFDSGVGLTPADQYWAWINRTSGLVDFWEMLLTGSKPDDKPTRVTFRDWGRHGGILMSTRRESDGYSILLNGLRVMKSVPEGAFTK